MWGDRRNYAHIAGSNMLRPPRAPAGGAHDKGMSLPRSQRKIGEEGPTVTAARSCCCALSALISRIVHTIHLRCQWLVRARWVDHHEHGRAVSSRGQLGDRNAPTTQRLRICNGPLLLEW